jgi:Sec7-like guanine-nucleotide exchange factor
MLESFRLPGEAQQIERIMEIFSITYFESGPGMIIISLILRFFFVF